MPLTEHSNVFSAIHEDVFKKIVEHLMRQRPSLFNYGSLYFAGYPDRMCHKIVAHPEVIRRANPLVTIEDPLPIPGTGGRYGIDFCAQLVDAKIDFYPGNAIEFPPQLKPLGAQRAGVAATFCVGLACPSAERAEFLGDLIAAEAKRGNREDEQRPPIEPIPPNMSIASVLKSLQPCAWNASPPTAKNTSYCGSMALKSLIFDQKVSKAH